MKKRLLAGVLAAAMLFTNLGMTSYAEDGVLSDSVSENQMLLSQEEQTSEETEIIRDYAGLAAALTNGGNYTIEGEISTDRPELDKPLIVEKDVTFKGGAISLDQCVHLTSEADHDFTKEAEKSTRVFLRTDCVLFLCMEQWCSVNNAGT